MGSISALGSSEEEIITAYSNDKTYVERISIGKEETWVAKLSDVSKSKIEALKTENQDFRKLDPSVHYALFSSRQAVANAGWNGINNIGVNIGSSRGATQLFEKYHESFLRSGRSQVLSSPTTTLGNISSWVAQDIGTTGPDISHSITCSTSLHAIINGIAWIRSGLCERFLCGGSEAPLTPFTIAQMKALKIYSSEENGKYPCRSLDLNKTANTMILGEGAAVFALENKKTNTSLAKIIGIGYATEKLSHAASISDDAKCFQNSMKMAINNHAHPDVIITHSPGTVQGDKAEFQAIKTVFGEDIPALNCNKWKMGHTLGASGALSLEMAVLMIKEQKSFDCPFIGPVPNSNYERILVNAVGFGGNAVSIYIEAC